MKALFAASALYWLVCTSCSAGVIRFSRWVLLFHRASWPLKVCSQHTNWTDLQQVDPVRLHDAFIGHARQRRDLIGCSETGTVGAQSVRALWTLIGMQVYRTPVRELQFSSVHVLWTNLNRRTVHSQTAFAYGSRVDLCCSSTLSSSSSSSPGNTKLVNWKSITLWNKHAWAK